MKRILTIALVLACLSAAVYAQNGDARAKGLAGAMTAMGDDMNALFYNPAGLAFVRKSYFNVEANANISLNKGAIINGGLPYVYTDYTGTNYVYYDDFTGSTLSFDFEQYKSEIMDFASQLGSNKTWADMTDADKYKLYQKYQSARSTYDSLGDMNPITANPRVIIGNKHWGLSAFGEYALNPDFPAGYKGLSSQFQYNVTRRLGAVAGIGLDFGPIAVGANAKYVQDATYSKAFDFSQMYEKGPQWSDIQDLFTHKIDVSAGDTESTTIEVGLGALFTLGTLNVGIYNDNIMPFLNEDTKTLDYGVAFMNKMNFGVSWMPSDNKFKNQKVPLVLLFSADLKNFGDEVNRQLCGGVETGLNAGDFLQALLRFGYTQPLPGTYAEMSKSFNTDLGSVSLGATAKLWFAKFDAAFTLPVSVLKDINNMSGSVSDAERLQRFGTISVTFSAAF
jgi:hypothetical protein